jgi:hypothetical protein
MHPRENMRFFQRTKSQVCSIVWGFTYDRLSISSDINYARILGARKDTKEEEGAASQHAILPSAFYADRHTAHRRVTPKLAGVTFWHGKELARHTHQTRQTDAPKYFFRIVLLRN